jgi:hypothetical protein
MTTTSSLHHRCQVEVKVRRAVVEVPEAQAEHESMNTTFNPSTLVGGEMQRLLVDREKLH